LSILHLRDRRLESADGHTTVSADFVRGGKSQRVWFRTNSDFVCESFDPFLPVALIPAMRRKWTISIEGPVSTKLLQGVEDVQRLMTDWYPDFRKVDLQSQTAAPRISDQTGVASFFSGGVDSFYTLQQHLEEINHLIFVHGFDIPLSHSKDREKAATSARKAADQLGLRLIEVETNLRQFGQPHVSWPYAYFGAGLAAVALFLSPLFERVYLPASVSRDQLVPMGSHPDLDLKWSNEQMRLVHDGIDATRFEKVQSIGAWDVARKWLRVCYQLNTEHLNCGRCRKCLWTMMMLRASGDLDQVESFAVPLDLDELRLYPPVPRYERDRFHEAVALLRSRDADPEFQNVLCDMLAANGRVPIAGKTKRLLTRARNYFLHRH
jgi:hypothetical protein